MSPSIRNIQFNYLYRDASNYKMFGHAILSNPDNIDVDQIDKAIKLNLIDGEFFEPAKWGLAPLCFEDWDDDSDHFWNEYHCIEETNSDPTFMKTVTEFLKYINADSKSDSD